MRKHRSAEQWQDLIDQQRSSGLPVNKFCEKHGVGYASFCKWRKRLSDQNQSLSDNNRPSAEKADFLDLSALMGSATSSGPGWNIVLSLGNGVELRLSQSG